jgi:hypothetical protein
MMIFSVISQIIIRKAAIVFDRKTGKAGINPAFSFCLF